MTILENSWLSDLNYEFPDEDELEQQLQEQADELHLEPEWSDVDWSDLDSLEYPDDDLDGIIK